MTTVACNKEEMACDLQMTQAGMLKWKAKTKIYKFKANEETYPQCDFLIGFAGSALDIITSVEFFSNPQDFKRIPRVGQELTGLVLTEKGDIYMFAGHLGKWLLLEEPFAAIGTGSLVAVGALEAGASPKDAVKAASKRDPFTGMGYKSYTWK